MAETVKKTALKEEEVKKMTGWEPVQIRLFKDNNKYKEPLYASVNNRSFHIPRGITVTVPYCVAKVIEQSQAQDERTAMTIEHLVSEYSEKERG